MNAELYGNLGRLANARAMTDRLGETVASLTPHHRVHGLAIRLTLENAIGDWQAVRDLTHRTTEAVEANLATPCPFNVGLLLTLAAGWAVAGDQAECGRLIARAEGIGMVGYGRMQVAHRLGLGLVRQDQDEIGGVVGSVEASW